MTPEERAETVLSLMVVKWDETRQLSGYCWDGWRSLVTSVIREAIQEERERICKVIRDRGTKNGIYCAIDPEKTIEAIQK